MLYFIVILLALTGCSRGNQPPAPAQHDAPAAPAQPAAPDPRPVIVAFGDSLTAGFGVDPGLSYPDFLQKELDRRGYAWHVINAGVSGDTTTDGLARVDSVLGFTPAIVILEFGGNDGLRGLPLSTTRANLEQMVAALQRGGASVVLAGMTLPPNYGPDYIRSFERIYLDLGARPHVRLLPFLLAGVAGTSLMQPDGLHATAAGNRIVAANVLRALEPLLAGKNSHRE